MVLPQHSTGVFFSRLSECHGTVWYGEKCLIAGSSSRERSIADLPRRAWSALVDYRRR